ncbi:hypothetical protein D3C78_1611790 [compost metagenome]
MIIARYTASVCHWFTAEYWLRTRRRSASLSSLSVPGWVSQLSAFTTCTMPVTGSGRIA